MRKRLWVQAFVGGACDNSGVAAGTISLLTNLGVKISTLKFYIAPFANVKTFDRLNFHPASTS